MSELKVHAQHLNNCLNNNQKRNLSLKLLKGMEGMASFKTLKVDVLSLLVSGPIELLALVW